MTQDHDTQLRWLRGNDVLLRLHVSEIIHDDATGSDNSVPFDLTQASSVAVTMRNASHGRQVSISVAPAEDDASVLIVDVPSDTPVGTYTIVLTLQRGGRDACAVRTAAFNIVTDERLANIHFDEVQGPVTADMQVALRYITQAVARGKNAYELWLEAGNEGTLEDYLNTFWQPTDATQEVSGLMSAADKQWLDQVGDIEVMTADQAADLVHNILSN
jgi:hypothetical protein